MDQDRIRLIYNEEKQGKVPVLNVKIMTLDVKQEENIKEAIKNNKKNEVDIKLKDLLN